MTTPHFAMVDLPFDGALRWGTRTAAALREERAADPAGGVRVFYGAASRDLEEPTRQHLAAGAYTLLQMPSFKRHVHGFARTSASRKHVWLLWEGKNRLREVDHAQLAQTFTAIHAFQGTAKTHFRKALIEVSPGRAGTDPETAVAQLLSQLSVLVVGATSIGHGRGLPATLVIGRASDPQDDAAVLSFREGLLALDWPDSHAVGRQLGSTGAGAESRVSRERAAGTLFGVWAGHDRSGYRHPTFQFLPSGSVHERLPELLDALARQPGLTQAADRTGWKRAFWLYQPRGRLSVQALALRAAAPAQLRADPARFAALDTAARTPAEVFASDPQAVIDLARDDAAALAPPEASPDASAEVAHG